MKVSVIVSIYNGADVLPVTIPRFLDQDYPRELTEIIMVDDASTDETPILLENKEWTDRATVIRHKENRGRAATRNSGINAATGDLLIFTDYDIEVGPRFIQEHASHYTDGRTVGVLSNVRPKEMNPHDKFHRYLFYGRKGAQRVGKGQPLPFKYFIMTCSSMKSSAMKATGRFNERLPGYGIDLEYAYRLWSKYPDGLFYDPDIIVYMHKTKSLKETVSDFRDYGRRNVPVILEEFPELAPYVGADFVRSPSGNFSLKSVAGSLLINKVGKTLAKLLFTLAPYPSSSFFIRYLMVSGLVTGYRESLTRFSHHKS